MVLCFLHTHPIRTRDPLFSILLLLSRFAFVSIFVPLFLSLEWSHALKFSLSMLTRSLTQVPLSFCGKCLPLAEDFHLVEGALSFIACGSLVAGFPLWDFVSVSLFLATFLPRPVVTNFPHTASALNPSAQLFLTSSKGRVSAWSPTASAPYLQLILAPMGCFPINMPPLS